MAEDKVGRARTQDNVGCVFINHVMGSGHLNGVINVTLGTINFMPSRDAKQIVPELEVSCRLRLDVVAATELRAAIDKSLNMMIVQAETDTQDDPKSSDTALN